MKLHYILVATLFLSLSPMFVFGQNNILDQSQKLLDKKKNNEVIQLLATKEKSFDHNARYYEILGKANHGAKNFDKAIACFEKCILLENSNAEYHYLKGNTLINKLEITDNFFKKGVIASTAKEALLRAIELQPSHINARVRLSNYYIHAPVIAGGSSTKAKQQALEIIKYAPEKGHILMAGIFWYKKELEAAEREYLKVYNLYPKNRKIRYRLSVFYLEMKQYQKAFEYCNKSINKFPDYFIGYYQYAKIASIAKKNISKAISYINYFLKNSSNDDSPKKHWAYYRLALLLKEQGKEYKTAVLMALELKPDFEPAKKLLN